MTIALTVSVVVALVLAVWCALLLRRGRSATKELPRKFYFRAAREEFDLEELKQIPKDAILRQQIQDGEESRDVLDKLGRTLQYQQQSAIANIVSLDGILTDPRDKLVFQAGWLAGLNALEEGLRGAVSAGEVAKTQLHGVMREQMSESVVPE